MTDACEWREAPPGDFAVLGDPVSHSLSPRMQSAAFEALGLTHTYEAIRVPVVEFDEAATHLSRLGYRGLNVTVPLKEIAFQWAGEPDEIATRIGAANTLDLRSGRATNTDAPGFLDVLADLGVRPPAKVLVLGAGGTARALAVALDAAGFPFTVYNRTSERARTMLASLTIEAPVASELSIEGFGAVVNATSAELSGSSLDFDWNAASPECRAIDMFYAAGETAFVRDAHKAGLTAVDGRAMLVAQGARSLEWWLGVEAPRSAMLRAIS